MTKKLTTILLLVFTISIFGTMNIESSERIPYKRLDPLAVSTFRADRVVYQQIEQDVTPYYDDSFASLLIIRDSKMYFFEDGYDDRIQEMKRYQGARASGYMIPDLWPNKISGKLNHVIVTDRRLISLRGFDSDAIESRFGQEYRDTRDKLIKKHTEVFYGLLTRPHEIEMAVVRRPIPRKFMDDEPIRYFSSVTVKTFNGRVYYAEDTTGDGVTNTFTVTEPDGFNWGFKSGPNVICIINNTQEDIKEMIGTLVFDAQNGTEAFWEKAKKEFIPSDQMDNFIDDLYGVSEARPRRGE